MGTGQICSSCYYCVASSFGKAELSAAKSSSALPVGKFM